MRTTLDAVNKILTQIGETPIHSLTDHLPADAALALQTLEEVHAEVEAQAWAWSRVEKECIPDAEMKIRFPAEIVDVQAPRSKSIYIIRDGVLWDYTNNTSQFTEPVTLVLTLHLPFEAIPAPFRNWITIRAARRFADKAMGSETMHTFTERDEVLAKAAAWDWQGFTVGVSFVRDDETALGRIFKR